LDVPQTLAVFEEYLSIWYMPAILDNLQAFK